MIGLGSQDLQKPLVNEWKRYIGKLSWDELSYADQNKILLSSLRGDDNFCDLVISYDLKKSDIIGLDNLFLAGLRLLEREKNYAINTDYRKPDDIRDLLDLFNGTLIGRRLASLIVSGIYDTDRIYLEELQFLAHEEKFFEALNMDLAEFKAFIKCVFSLVPSCNEIEILKTKILTSIQNNDDKSALKAVVLNDMQVFVAPPDLTIDAFKHGCFTEDDLETSMMELKNLGLINFISSEDEDFLDYYPDYEIEPDYALLAKFKIWLTQSGRELSREIGHIAKEYLVPLELEQLEKEKRKKLNFQTGVNRKKELEKKILEQGGWVFSGIYQGNRRVKAKEHDLHSYWILSPEEGQLIQFLGTNKIPEKINPVDFKHKYGLAFKKELAPAVIELRDSGGIDITRLDQWGMDAVPWKSDRSFLEMDFSAGSIRVLLIMPLIILMFLPAFILTPLSQACSKKANLIIAASLTFGLLIFFGIFVNQPYRSGLEKISYFYLFSAVFPFLKGLIETDRI